MFQAIIIASVFLVPTQADDQISGSFYKHAHVKALVVDVEGVSPENMREIADALVYGMGKEGVGPLEMRIDDDGRYASFLAVKKDKGQATRTVLKALYGRADRILVVIASWPLQLDGQLAGQLEKEAAAIEHSHAFDRGVEDIFYEWSPQ